MSFRYSSNTYTHTSNKAMVSAASEVNLEIEQAWRELSTIRAAPQPKKRDTVGMMMGVVGSQATQSAYKANFVFEEEAKADIREKDFTHHYKRDFAKVYSEAVLKHRSVLRK
jgi:hypothetical protein